MSIERPLILFGDIERRDDDWALTGRSVPGGEIRVDQTDMRALEAPTTVITFEDEVVEDSRVSVTGFVVDDGEHPVIRARGIASHDAIQRLANEMSLAQSRESGGRFTGRSSVDYWLNAERQLLGLNLALWWGHVSITSDFLQMNGGNVPGNLAAIYQRQWNGVDQSGLVSAVGRIGQKRLFFNPGTGKEFFLLVEHIVGHDEISELAHRFHDSGDEQLSAWLRAERELLLRLA